MIKRIDTSELVLAEILELLNALNDKSRQEIIMIFNQKPECRVTEIAAQFKLSRPTISHHLNLMRRARILNARKEGKEIYYSFNKDYVVGKLEQILSYFKGCC